MRETGKQGALRNARPLRILIVEDQAADAELNLAILKRAGYTLSFEIVDTTERFKERIENVTFDLILSDHNLRTWTGLDVLECLRNSGKEIPFIVVTGTLGDEAAVEYIKQGAADYVLKHRLERLPVVVGRALRERAQREETARLQEVIVSAKKDWELTFDQVPDAVFILDEEGRVRRANRAATQFTGKEFNQMIGLPCYEVIRGLREPRLDRPGLEEWLEMSGGVGKDIEKPRLGKVFEVTSSPLRGTSGELCGAVVVMRNVTEQRRIDAEIRKAKDDWELTFNTVPDPIIVMDEECRITRANQAAANLPGLQPEQVIGKHCYEVLHQSQTPRPDCPHQELLKTGLEAHGDIYEPWLDKFFATSATPIRDPSGALRGCVHVLRDVTARKRAEEALRSSEGKFRKAFNTNPEPVTISALADGRYIDVNQTFLRIMGFRREEVIGRTSIDIGFWEKPEDRVQFIAEIQRQGRVDAMEIRFHTKAGESRVGLLSAEKFEMDHQQHLLAVTKDITEYKNLEQQLRQSQKMEAIGQLAGGVAHDFNNLLTIISGYGELVSTGLGSEHPHQGHVKEIQQAADRASGLTRQLLAFGRRQVLAPQILDLNTVLTGMDKMLRRLIGEDIDLVCVPASALGRVKADPGQVEQIIMNLAINARDAMPKGGKLSIETADVNLDESYARGHISMTPGAYVMLAVSDTGCGMDAETQSRIFEPFFTTKSLGKGTGLGLATVYGIVKQSGGHIWVYSEPGKGSTFKIYLPAVDGPISATGKVQVISGNRRGTETVLVVEDEETIRQLVRHVLESRGYGVLDAKSGAEALSICLGHPGAIHLILTDVVMPQMSGPELAQQWAARRPETRIIYMSGYTNNAICHHELLDRNLAFIEKPFTPQALAEKVREVLDAGPNAQAA